MRFMKRHAGIVEVRKKHPKLTYFLIVVMVLTYIGEIIYSNVFGDASTLFNALGFSWDMVMSGGWWTFVTSIFIHATPEHLILNIIALYFFGHIVEHELGKKKYLLIFFLTAFAGSLAILLATMIGIMPAAIPSLGASAAVFGLMGTAMLIRPFGLVMFPYIIPVPLIVVAVLYTLYNIGAFLAVVFSGAETQVAYIAHLGGLALGIFFGYKEEGTKRSLLTLALVILILLAIPFVLNSLESFSYVPVFTSMFG